MRITWLMTAMAWWLGTGGAAGQTKVDLGRQAKNVDFSQAGRSRPFPSGSELPTQCETGDTFLKTGSTVDQELFICSAAHTWTAVGKELPAGGLSAGRILKVGYGGLEWTALGGDVTGDPDGVRVRGLQGKPVSTSQPSDGDALVYDASLGTWVPRVPPGTYEPGAGVVMAGNVITVDAATIPSYSLGTGAPSGSCSPGRDYYLDASAHQLYYCASEGSWRSLSSGDHAHTWGSLTGSMSDQADLSSALASKADQSHSHALGGDLAGSLAGATVVRIQGRPVSASSPTEGATLVWNSSSQQWEPRPPGGQANVFDPLDSSLMWLRDEFCGHASGGQQIGNLGWWSYATGTVTSYGLSSGGAEMPCTFRDLGVSSTNANDYRAIILSNPGGIIFQGGRTVPWRAVFRFGIASGTAYARARFGFGPYDYGLVPSAFIGVRLDRDANWDGEAAGTWIACVCNGTAKSNCTDIDTQVTVSDGSWYKLEIWSESAGVINMRINGGSTITFNNVATTPGTNVTLQPHWIMGRTGGTGTVRAEIDFFGFLRTGLNR